MIFKQFLIYLCLCLHINLIHSQLNSNVDTNTADMNTYTNILTSNSKLPLPLPMKILIICFQKNEYELIDYWFLYYSKLFSIENLIMLDNYSDNIKVINSLAYWEKKGI